MTWPSYTYIAYFNRNQNFRNDIFQNGHGDATSNLGNLFLPISQITFQQKLATGNVNALLGEQLYDQ